MLNHPASMIRDTSLYAPFRNKVGKASKLKNLALEHLAMNIQEGHHSSVDDAIAAMKLFQLHKKEWDTISKKMEHRKSQLKIKNNGVELRRWESIQQSIANRDAVDE
jgi:inhibitor of KinA sporulation pathway (predicted exonuclease)